MNALNHPAARHHSPSGAWQRPAKGFVSMATLRPPQIGFGAERGQAAVGLPHGWQRRHQTMASIRAEYLPKLKHLKQAAYEARCAGKPALVISLMIDLVCWESMMLHDMARTTNTCVEKLACERVIRPVEIGVLADCALLAGDRDAQLLAEVLLQSYRRYMAAAVAASTAQAALRGAAVA